MEPACRDEIVHLHDFFEGWFTGCLADNDAVFKTVERALAPGFTLISPRGLIEGREALLESIRRAYGKRSSFRITIENVRTRQVTDELWLVIYEEWQRDAEMTTGRLSTALLGEDRSGPHGLIWLHVHETWLSSGRQ